MKEGIDRNALELQLWRDEAALMQRDDAHPNARAIGSKLQARVAMRLADELARSDAPDKAG